MRYASRSVVIEYVVLAENGKTPVFDSASQSWAYKDAPTAEQMTASANRLLTAEQRAQTALTKSDAADAKAASAISKADTAKEVADTKVTGDEAVEEVKTQMFEITPLQRGQGITTAPKLRTIEFEEVSSGNWKVWVTTEGSGGQADNSDTRGWLAYAELSEFNALVDRVIELEEKVAALERKVGK